MLRGPQTLGTERSRRDLEATAGSIVPGPKEARKRQLPELFGTLKDPPKLCQPAEQGSPETTGLAKTEGTGGSAKARARSVPFMLASGGASQPVPLFWPKTQREASAIEGHMGVGVWVQVPRFWPFLVNDILIRGRYCPGCFGLAKPVLGS